MKSANTKKAYTDQNHIRRQEGGLPACCVDFATHPRVSTEHENISERIRGLMITASAVTACGIFFFIHARTIDESMTKTH